MGRRAEPSGVTLDSVAAAIVKGMLVRGDRQHDIAAWFGVNAGRVAEIASGVKFASVPTARQTMLPPPGPYLSVRQLYELSQTAASASSGR
jgi:hypothetical protein